MDDFELRTYIIFHPESDVAKAYWLGMKDKSESLSKTIEKLDFTGDKKKNG